MTEITGFQFNTAYLNEMGINPFIPTDTLAVTPIFDFSALPSNIDFPPLNFSNLQFPDFSNLFKNNTNFTNIFNTNFSFNTQTPIFQTPTVNQPFTTDNTSFNSCFSSSKGMFDTFTHKNNSKIKTVDVTDKTKGTVETVRTVDDIDYSIMGESASKVKQLKPEMQKKVYAMFKYAKSKGWTMTITSGHRSTQKQADLYNKWKAGKHKVPIVAKPGTSKHEFGCAVDINLKCNGVSDKKLYAEMGQFGESIGLRWGGNWKKNREAWHFDINQNQTSVA